MRRWGNRSRPHDTPRIGTERAVMQAPHHDFGHAPQATAMSWLCSANRRCRPQAGLAKASVEV